MNWWQAALWYLQEKLWFRLKRAQKCSSQFGWCMNRWRAARAPEASARCKSSCQTRPQKSLSEGIGGSSLRRASSVFRSEFFYHKKMRFSASSRFCGSIKTGQRARVELRLKHEKMVKPTLNDYIFLACLISHRVEAVISEAVLLRCCLIGCLLRQKTTPSSVNNGPNMDEALFESCDSHFQIQNTQNWPRDALGCLFLLITRLRPHLANRLGFSFFITQGSL